VSLRPVPPLAPSSIEETERPSTDHFFDLTFRPGPGDVSDSPFFFFFSEKERTVGEEGLSEPAFQKSGPILDFLRKVWFTACPFPASSTPCFRASCPTRASPFLSETGETFA